MSFGIERHHTKNATFPKKRYMKNLSAFINYRYLMAIVPAFLLTSIAFNQETSKQSRSEYPIGQIFKKDYNGCTVIFGYFLLTILYYPQTTF